MARGTVVFLLYGRLAFSASTDVAVGRSSVDNDAAPNAGPTVRRQLADNHGRSRLFLHRAQAEH